MASMVRRRSTLTAPLRVRVTASLAILLVAGACAGEPDVTRDWPPPVRGARLVAHPSGVLVLFGGETARATYHSATWLFDVGHGTWHRVDGAGPPGRIGHAVAYDPAADRVVLFGGLGESGLLNDVWVFDVQRAAWEEVVLRAPPHPRWSVAMAHDTRVGGIVVFGGIDREGPAADTWRLDVVSRRWVDLRLPAGPPARGHHVMASASARVVMLGAHPGAPDPRLDPTIEDTVWTFDGTWGSIPTGHAPPPLLDSALVAVDGGRLLLAGGQASIGRHADGIRSTWWLDISQAVWSPGPDLPERRTGVAMAAHEGVVYVFGGCAAQDDWPSADMWRLSTSGLWEEVSQGLR